MFEVFTANAIKVDKHAKQGTCFLQGSTYLFEVLSWKTILSQPYVGVVGMSKGRQILLLGILVQRLHHNSKKFWTNYQVLSFFGG